MRALTIAATLMMWLAASSVAAQVHVRGYTRADGTYVAPHYRSSPNSTTADNYSTRGNINPYTGERGTRSPAPEYIPEPYYPSVAVPAQAPTPAFTSRISLANQTAPLPPSILTGSDIFEHCGPQANLDQQNTCLGYLNGTNDSVDSLSAAGLVTKPYCFASDLTVGELATRTARAIRDDSEMWTTPVFWALLSVWTRLFPCPSDD